MKTVIIVSSRHGFTEKAAEKLSEKLNSLVDIKSLDKNFERDFSEYHNIIFGSPVYGGKLRPLTVKFIKENIEQLNTKNLGFFVCSKENNNVEKIIASNLPNAFTEQLKIKGEFGYGVNFDQLSGVEKVATRIIMKKGESEAVLKDDNIAEFAAKVNQFDLISR